MTAADNPMTVNLGPVRVAHDGGVLDVWLNSPPLNTIDSTTQAALARVVDMVVEDDDVRAVVLRGSERVFAAGADIKLMATMGFEEIVGWNRRLQQVFTAIAELPVPVVAAISGLALGGGLELALCADYRIAGQNSRMGLPEVQLGIMPGSGGTQRLTEIVGRSRAKELIMTGRWVAAGEALRLGIVDEVTAPGDAYPRAVEVARALSSGPRFAIRAIKEAIDHADRGSSAGLALERSLIAGLFATRDRETGMRSFLEHGPGKANFA